MLEAMILAAIKSMMEANCSIRYTSHANQRMVERDIDSDEVLHILKNAATVEKESDSQGFAGKQNYRVKAEDGKNSVVVSVYHPDHLIIVTVID